MSETPTVGYNMIRACTTANDATSYAWSAAAGQVGVPGTVTMSTADVLHASLWALGSASVTAPITISLASNTAAITVNSGISGCAVGMGLAASTAFYDVTPHGLQIIDVNTGAGTILAGGKDAMADCLGGMTVAEMIATDDGLFVNGPATLNDLPFVVVDQFPYGSLAVTVTPSTGTTVKGYNYDDSQTQATDDGTAMSNSGGQALSYFTVAFSNAGTYEIAAAYTSTDSNYSDASAASLTVVVS